MRRWPRRVLPRIATGTRRAWLPPMRYWHTSDRRHRRPQTPRSAPTTRRMRRSVGPPKDLWPATAHRSPPPIGCAGNAPPRAGTTLLCSQTTNTALGGKRRPRERHHPWRSFCTRSGQRLQWPLPAMRQPWVRLNRQVGEGICSPGQYRQMRPTLSIQSKLSGVGKGNKHWQLRWIRDFDAVRSYMRFSLKPIGQHSTKASA
jgi:hypothetical protein